MPALGALGLIGFRRMGCIGRPKLRQTTYPLNHFRGPWEEISKGRCIFTILRAGVSPIYSRKLDLRSRVILLGRSRWKRLRILLNLTTQ